MSAKSALNILYNNGLRKDWSQNSPFQNAGIKTWFFKTIPTQDTWYEPRSIYESVNIQDNNTAFYELTGTSINKLSDLQRLQPNL